MLICKVLNNAVVCNMVITNALNRSREQKRNKILHIFIAPAQKRLPKIMVTG